MNKAQIWPQAGANTGRTQLDQRPLVVYRGRVVSVAEGVPCTTVSGPNGYMNISSVPEVWVVDAQSKELRFRDVTVAGCRVGHEILIVGDPAKDRVLAMRNLTTGQTWYAPSMADLPVNSGHIMTIVFAGILFFGIASFITFVTFGEPWARETIWQQNGPVLFYGLALYLSWWLPERGRLVLNSRKDALRGRVLYELDAALA